MIVLLQIADFLTMLIPLLASVLSTVPSPDRSSSSHAARAPCLLQNYGTSLPLEVASSEGFFPEVGECAVTELESMVTSSTPSLTPVIQK